MALTHKLSDAVKMHIDTDDAGNPVIEISFKYVRYRLIVDNKERANDMLKFLNIAVTPHKTVPAPEMPKFYKKET